MESALDRGWRDGVSAEDRGSLRAAIAASPRRAGEGRVLLALAGLIAGEVVEAPTLVGGRDGLAAACRAARAWAYGRAGLAGAAAEELTAIAALSQRPAARGFVDLAIAELAHLAGDAETAATRWTALATETGLAALRVHACLRLGGHVRDASDLPASRRHVEDAARFARAAARPGHLADAEALLAAHAVIAGEAGTPPALRDVLTSGAPVLVAGAALADARAYAAADRDAAALLVLATAAAALATGGSCLVPWLRAERDRLCRRWGEARFVAAEAAALVLATT